MSGESGGPPPPAYGRQQASSRSDRPAGPYPGFHPTGRVGAFISLENSSIIDVRTTNIDENAALTGNRSQRQIYWDRQLQYNLNNWRRGQIGMLQIDSQQRLWGINLQCQTNWNELRQSETPPKFTLIWDSDLSEFRLYCSQSQGGDFILSGNSA